MKRLTVHLELVPPVIHNGKQKVFNTITFPVKTGSEEEVQQVTRYLSGVTKTYVSNVK